MAIHRVTVGNLKCTILNELSQPFTYRQRMPERFPKTEWSEIRTALDEIQAGNTSTDSMNCFLVDDGDVKLLVDTGIGDPEQSDLLTALEEAGVTPEAIDVVMISHFHGDHFSGVSDAHGTPTFPQARYVAAQTEWDYWMEGSSDRAVYAQNKLQPLADQFSFVQPGDEILPGITVVDLAGHTPGQVGLLLESEGDRLLFVADILHTVPQFVRPDWHFVWDSLPEQAVAMRRASLRRAADETLLTLFYHLPFPGLGHVVQVDDAFRWQPIDES